MEPSQGFKAKYAYYSIEDGILNTSWHSNLVVTLDIAKEMVEERILFCNGETMPTLVDIRGLASIDTISRKYLASERCLSNVSAGAILTGSLISKLAGNIYITVDKQGNVTDADPNGKGTTTSSGVLKSKARQAALQAKFSPDDKFETQRGSIVFKFQF